MLLRLPARPKVIVRYCLNTSTLLIEFLTLPFTFLGEFVSGVEWVVDPAFDTSVTESLRYTSALILRNLARISSNKDVLALHEVWICASDIHFFIRFLSLIWALYPTHPLLISFDLFRASLWRSASQILPSPLSWQQRCSISRVFRASEPRAS